MSTTEWSRVQHNSIIVQGLFGTDLKSYDEVKLGKNVKAPLKHSTSHGNIIHWKELNLHSVKNEYAVIVTTLTTIQSCVTSGEIILINNVYGSDIGMVSHDKSVMSQYVLLAVLQSSQRNARNKISGWNWGKKHYEFASDSKDNIMTCSNKHHDCKGLYFSWGNKANYGRKGNSSVGQYATKSSLKAKLCGNTIMEMMNLELKASIMRLNRVFNNMHTMITPVMHIAHAMQSNVGNIGIQRTSASDAGVWQSSLCINAVTKGWHTENDVTYTIISVPYQTERNHDIQYHFLFKLQGKYTLSIPLNEGTTVLFSGKMLTHRQSSNVFDTTYDDLFFNFASYGNKKMYNHIRQSFIRCGI